MQEEFRTETYRRSLIRKPSTESEEATWTKRPERIEHNSVLVFDTETTPDQIQAFRHGCAQLYIKVPGSSVDAFKEKYTILFYDEKAVTKEETNTLKWYAKKHNMYVYTLTEFLEKRFYTEVFKHKALCVGFNLPFDIARIADHAGEGRNTGKHGFSFALTKEESKQWPHVVIKEMGNADSIGFSSWNRGYFVDVSTLASVLLQRKSITLKELAKELKTKHQKAEAKEHGKITEEYLDYSVMDVRVTFDCYKELMKNLKAMEIPIPPTKIYSSASIGKYALEHLGIKPFREFEKPILPIEEQKQIMSGYFGGRCECKIRKTFVPVTTLDFTSMYPSVFGCLGLWQYVTASEYEIKDVTQQIQGFLHNVTLESMQNMEAWKDFVVMVSLKPDKDILPVRADYTGTGKGAKNIAVSYYTDDKALWYALPDVIASVLLSGKVPVIESATRYIVKEKQSTLTKKSIAGIEIDANKDDLFKLLIEKRQVIKQEMKKYAEESIEYKTRRNSEQALKILANATSYGIFVELNPEEEEKEVEVYTMDTSFKSIGCVETEGKYFNPLIAVMITSGARLFLALAEAKLNELAGNKKGIIGHTHAYMDTDSIFVPPQYAQAICDYFEALNPYNKDVVKGLLKVEKEGRLFFCISSKRYALPAINEKGEFYFIKKTDYKLHGLGAYKSPFKNEVENWHGAIWLRILNVEKGNIKLEEMLEEFRECIALTQLKISTPYMLKNVKAFNEGKEYKDQIKPYNFCLQGYEKVKGVLPLCSHSSNPQTVVYDEFINKYTGELMQGEQYFRTMYDVISKYMVKPEYKLSGDKGVLERKHVIGKKVIPIGKEAHKLDEHGKPSKNVQSPIDYEKVTEEIKGLSFKDIEHLGIGERTLREIKQKIRLGQPLNWKHGTVKKLAEHLRNC